MYIINQESNRIEKIECTSFRDLGFRERAHLQEWIANDPSCLNEELLIIQKEFAGFNDTSERLDLLALDKQGNLVVIENKLDDTGRDVAWQVLKYASYCSTLNALQIISIYNQYLQKNGQSALAEQIIEDFLESEDYKEKLNLGNSQRIIMIAGEYRKEVTSTVLWLLSNGLRIQCFKATPFRLNEKLLLNVEQIIPIKEAEDYVISMANKTREEIGAQENRREMELIRPRFWNYYLKGINEVCPLYRNVNVSKDNWISAGSGISGVTFTSVVTRNHIRIELAIHGKTQEENKQIFDTLENQKVKIESTFGKELVWERLSDKRMSRIKYQLDDVDISNEKDWPKMLAFMVKFVPSFVESFKHSIHLIKQK